MKKFLFFILLSFGILFSQEAQVNREKVDLNVLAGISTFSLDGKVKVFEAPMSVGIVYKGIDEDFNPGLYFSPIIDEGDQSNSSLSTMIYVTLFKEFGIGFGYKFWRSGMGIVEPKNSNLYLSFNFGLLKLNIK